MLRCKSIYYKTLSVGLAQPLAGELGACYDIRILVFTSMMLRVLDPAAFGSYGAGILYA